MAVYTHGVTNGDVLEAIEGIVDTSQIDATSNPINTSQIDRWVDEGAAQVNSALTKLGISNTADLSDDNATQQLADAIVSHAAYKTLRALGWSARAQEFKVDFNDMVNQFRTTPSALNKRATLTITDIDTSADKAKPFFSGKNYKF